MIIKDCIVTGRLILRRFVGGDEDDVLALMSDDYICRMPFFRTPGRIRTAIIGFGDRHPVH